MPEKTMPSTPQEVAAAVLDAIEAQPEAFDMDNWVGLQQGQQLDPGEACGTTLCAAGWAAHVTGWTLRLEGSNYWAVKGDRRRQIPMVAREALGLNDYETFWYADEARALERLREIAGR